MNESEKIEKVLVQLLEKFDEKSEQFHIAFSEQLYIEKQVKWYTPKQILLRLIRALVATSGPEFQAVGVALHGALDVLGFGGTTRLILQLRRKHVTRSKEKKNVPNL